MKALTIIVALAVLLTGVRLSLDQASPSPAITLTFVGDIMLGRSVGPVAAADPDGVFRDVRHLLRDSDLSFGNLESPLTSLSHQSLNPNVLIADPAMAELLATAGFDVVSLANNHAGDAGPGGVVETLEALASHEVLAVGAGRDALGAAAPVEVTVRGVRVAILAFDATGSGPVASTEPGIVAWDPAAARRAVTAASGSADVVITSIHGGVEYLPESDPRMLRIADLLVSWGADVVWGHGPHVAQPVLVADPNRSGIVATSLGNFLFDQRGPLTGRGVILQVLADRHGVIAHRTGTTEHHDLRVHFTGWDLPRGDAGLVQGSWWSLQRRPLLVSGTSPGRLDPFPWGETLAAGIGPLTGSQPELVVSYRAPSTSHPVRDGLPAIRWTDPEGYTMHLGIFRPADLAPVWQAGMVPAPIAALAVCDGSLALAYRSLESATVTDTGAAVWRPAGLTATDFLPGPGRPACGDVDADGRSDPLALDRPARGDLRP